jgi:hypothetical protein
MNLDLVNLLRLEKMVINEKLLPAKTWELIMMSESSPDNTFGAKIINPSPKPMGLFRPGEPLGEPLRVGLAELSDKKFLITIIFLT